MMVERKDGKRRRKEGVGERGSTEKELLTYMYISAYTTCKMRYISVYM